MFLLLFETFQWSVLFKQSVNKKNHGYYLLKSEITRIILFVFIFIIYLNIRESENKEDFELILLLTLIYTASIFIMKILIQKQFIHLLGVLILGISSYVMYTSEDFKESILYDGNDTKEVQDYSGGGYMKYLDSMHDDIIIL